MLQSDVPEPSAPPAPTIPPAPAAPAAPEEERRGELALTLTVLLLWSPLVLSVAMGVLALVLMLVGRR